MVVTQSWINQYLSLRGKISLISCHQGNRCRQIAAGAIADQNNLFRLYAKQPGMLE